MGRIRHIVQKEFIQIVRDPRMLALVLVSPVLQLLLFGYAATTDIKEVTSVVLDQDKTYESRELLRTFEASGYFRFRYLTDDVQDIASLLDRGKVSLALHVPPGFARDLKRGRPAEVQIIVDGTDSNTASIVLNYAAGAVSRFSGQVLERRAGRLRILVPRLPQIDNRVRAWYNPDLKSVNFMVPGVISQILLIVTLMLTSLAVVREREIGTLEQLIVTPIRPYELMLGKLIPFALLGFANVVFIIFVARRWFDVPIVGSIPLLLVLSGIFLMTSLGVGLFVSTVSRTQQQAMMTSFFIMQPSILLSGFMIPIENMPPAIQWLTQLIPLRYFVTIIRGIFLKGSGPAELFEPALILLAFGIVSLALGAWRFSRHME